MNCDCDSFLPSAMEIIFSPWPVFFKDDMIARHVIVKGRVQGVFFRDYTQKKALHYRLTGWVRNLPDGTVETLLCGEKEMVGVMLTWLKQGPPQSMVSNVIVDDIDVNEKFSTFEIRY